MPIYEYMCLDCGKKFETIRAMKDADAPINCENCQSDHTSRMLALFVAHSSGRVVAGGNRGCAGCGGGDCAACAN